MNMKLFKWKATFRKNKITGIIFATDIDKALVLVKQGLDDNGYDEKNIVDLRLKEIYSLSNTMSFYIISKKKRIKIKKKGNNEQ